MTLAVGQRKLILAVMLAAMGCVFRATGWLSEEGFIDLEKYVFWGFCAGNAVEHGIKLFDKRPKKASEEP